MNEFEIIFLIMYNMFALGAFIGSDCESIFLRLFTTIFWPILLMSKIASL